MVTDRVGDFIIRLQNAARIGTREVPVPHSLHLAAIAHKLKELGFIESVVVKDAASAKQKEMLITLSYDANGNAKLRGVKRMSKPGRRLYIPYADAHRVKGNTGARVLSSSTGIISDAEARKNRQGGEVLFEIW